MRIIGGKWRSRSLIRPRSTETRPVPDRVREAVFDILGSRYGTPGSLPAVRVADVFAGSGSMGLEALSRGAASCCFYERNREAVEALQANLNALGAGPEARIVLGDAWHRAAAAPTGESFDLLLLDPPYADSEDTSEMGLVKRYLARIDGLSRRSPLVVLHHRSTVRFLEDASGAWRIVDSRTYGTSTVTLFLQ